MRGATVFYYRLTKAPFGPRIVRADRAIIVRPGAVTFEWRDSAGRREMYTADLNVWDRIETEPYSGFATLVKE